MIKNSYFKLSGYVGLFGPIQFIVLSTVAMFYYGGGTAWNHDALGYTFWQNFLSDLGRTVSYSKVENTISSPLFNLSLGLFGLSIVMLHTSSLRLFRSKLGYPISIMGMISGVGMVVIALAPDDLSSGLHMLGVWIWALTLLFASVLIVIHELRSNDGNKHFIILSILMAFAIAFHISQGVFDIWGPIVATTQKIVMYLNCGWYLCLSRKHLIQS
jgi:hypothetical protein